VLPQVSQRLGRARQAWSRRRSRQAPPRRLLADHSSGRRRPSASTRGSREGAGRALPDLPPAGVEGAPRPSCGCPSGLGRASSEPQQGQLGQQPLLRRFSSPPGITRSDAAPPRSGSPLVRGGCSWSLQWRCGTYADRPVSRGGRGSRVPCSAREMVAAPKTWPDQADRPGRAYDGSATALRTRPRSPRTGRSVSQFGQLWRLQIPIPRRGPSYRGLRCRPSASMHTDRHIIRL
jgi:hypothetical protein